MVISFWNKLHSLEAISLFCGLVRHFWLATVRGKYTTTSEGVNLEKLKHSTNTTIVHSIALTTTLAIMQNADSVHKFFHRKKIKLENLYNQ